MSVVCLPQSQGAVNTLSRSLAIQLVDKGCRVNSITSGPVETPLKDEVCVLKGQSAYIQNRSLCSFCFLKDKTSTCVGALTFCLCELYAGWRGEEHREADHAEAQWKAEGGGNCCCIFGCFMLFILHHRQVLLCFEGQAFVS